MFIFKDLTWNSERKKIHCDRLFPPMKLTVHNHAVTLLDAKLNLQISQHL